MKELLVLQSIQVGRVGGAELDPKELGTLNPACGSTPAVLPNQPEPFSLLPPCPPSSRGG